MFIVMKVVTLAKAKSTLSALLDEVEKGQAVAISRRHRVVAEVRPAGPARPQRARPSGLAKGQFRVPAAFDQPLDDDTIVAFEGR